MADPRGREDPIAFAADRVFDGRRTLDGHAVWVEGGKVARVLPLDCLPEGVPLRREPGCTILPGLIDAHAHFMRWEGPFFLAHGVTTIRDVGNRLGWVLDRREEASGQLWPRILCLGPLLDGPAPVHEIVSRRCTDLAGAVAAVRETAATGVEGIKLYVGLEPNWLPAMVQESHAAGLKASMHCAGGGVVAAGRAGVDEFYHLDGILADVWPEHPPGWLDVWGERAFADTWEQQREVADSIAHLEMTATPTLVYWESQSQVRMPGYRQRDELRGVPPQIVEWQSGAAVCPHASERWRRALENAQRFVGLLLERGVPVLAGSDVPCGPVPAGLSLWRELSLLVEAGMSPEQALCAATSDAADFLERHELGRLRSGAFADMVFVRGDPLTRIPSRPDIALVVRAGVPYRPDDLLRDAEAAIGLADEPWAVQFEAHWTRAHPSE
jgi:imidazolonepropionase-like amidohydrolase